MPPMPYRTETTTFRPLLAWDAIPQLSEPLENGPYDTPLHEAVIVTFAEAFPSDTVGQHALDLRQSGLGNPLAAAYHLHDDDGIVVVVNPPGLREPQVEFAGLLRADLV